MQTCTRHFTNGQAPLYKSPNPNSGKYRDLPLGAVVTIPDGPPTEYNGVPFYEVDYTDAKAWRGWVYAGYLEPYLENFPRDCVQLDNQTETQTDAEQYVVYNGTRQVNLCGQIAAAYIARVSLTQLLEKWQAAAPTIWTRIFGKPGKVAGGTGIDDLISMLAAFNIPAASLAPALRDPFFNRTRYTPSGLLQLLKDHSLIVSVTIRSGRLAPSGALHWVVLTDLYPERVHYGAVSLFNPYFNRVEVYSWAEFIAAAKAPYGVMAEN